MQRSTDVTGAQFSRGSREPIEEVDSVGFAMEFGLQLGDSGAGSLRVIFSFLFFLFLSPVFFPTFYRYSRARRLHGRGPQANIEYSRTALKLIPCDWDRIVRLHGGLVVSQSWPKRFSIMLKVRMS
jgi:hypothetical protein